MNIENLILTKITQSGNMADVLNANVRSEFFHGKKSRKLWDWAYDYWVTHGKVPTIQAATRQDPTYDWADDVSGEPMSALIEELRTHHLHLLTQAGLAEAVALFDNADNDPREAIQAVNRLMATVNIDLAASDVERMSDYLANIVKMVLDGDSVHMAGIPTGFSFLDSQLGGMHAEQLLTLIGLPKRGKSTILLYIAMVAAARGYRVGLISFEMSNLEQKQRQICLGAGVSLTAIQRGSLTDIDRRKILDWEETMDDILRQTGGELILVHDMGSVTTVGGVTAKVEQLGLDLVIVDGVYMMQDEQGEKPNSSQALTNITRGFKRMCQRQKIPCLISTQASMFRSTKKGVNGMEAVMYSQSFVQDSDVIMAIDRPDLKKHNAIIKLLAARNAMGIEVDITVDLDHGVIRENGLVLDTGEIPDNGEDFDD